MTEDKTGRTVRHDRFTADRQRAAAFEPFQPFADLRRSP